MTGVFYESGARDPGGRSGCCKTFGIARILAVSFREKEKEDAYWYRSLTG